MTAAVRIGRDILWTDVMLDTSTSHHVILAGQTRSGKSSLAYVLLGGLSASPVVWVCGIDPTRVLLAPQAVASGDRWIVRGISGEAAVTMLGEVVAEMDGRLDLLERWRLDQIPAPSAEMPHVVVVLEEYSTLIRAVSAEDRDRRPGDRLAPRIESAVAALLAGGAKVLITVMLLTQRADAKVVGGEARSNFPTRISLRVGDAESLPMLFDLPPDSRVPSFMRSARPGEGVIQTPGMDPQLFIADHCSYTDYFNFVAGQDIPQIGELP